ncbi:MAG TPA: FTR1 family protein [Vicinamibacteria bacterium]|jgi:high-affinity iron transporter|nr:FTR1 family protein [Vicinamibacteria bacterium]
MKSIFKIAAGLAVVIAALGCRRAAAPAGPPAGLDGGDAQRLVALLDYVRGDYPMAVGNGVVLRQSEYDEQLRFAAEARRIASELLGTVALDEPLLAAIGELEARVKARASAEAVAQACTTARDEAVARFNLRTTPTERPSLARAATLYTQNCAVCHSERGDGRTERALLLNPPPASFKDPTRLQGLTPYRVYNALTFGVPGTAMATFDALTPAERWSLAFYVLRLGHAGEPVGAPVAMPLADLAVRSDHEILETLRAEEHPAPAAALAYLRTEAAFLEPPAGVGIDRTRALVRSALREFRAGRPREAERLVLDAYLQGYEPLEPRLRVRDPEGTAQTEAAFHALRASLARRSAFDVEARGRALEGRLQSLSGTRRTVLPFVSALLIYVREGIEAALVVGALLAGVRRLGRPEASRYIHAGWLLALPCGVLTWFVSERVIALAAHHRELVEAVIALLAAAVLFSMSFWLISKVESRRWMDFLRRQLEERLTERSLLVLSGLAFLAVYREAAETVLFTQALLLEAESDRTQVWAGAAAGLLAVAAVAVLMARTVVRLPLRPFFAVSGVLLCLLAISLAGAGVYELVSAGYLPPRPVAFPEIPWMGIHPDLTALLVQLAIAAVVAGGGVVTARRRA